MWLLQLMKCFQGNRIRNGAILITGLCTLLMGAIRYDCIPTDECTDSCSSTSLLLSSYVLRALIQ